MIDAVFVSVPLAVGAVAVIVIVLVAPALSVAREQFALASHDQPGPVAVINDVLLGKVSVTTTFAAADGPMFVTVSVYVNVLPAFTGFGETVLLMARSVPAFTVV